MPQASDRSDTLLALGLGMLAMPVLMVIYGAALAKLWEWFIADTFGVMALSTAQAIGVSMTVTFVTYQEDAKRDDDRDALEELIRIVITSLVRSVLLLTIGAVVKGFIG